MDICQGLNAMKDRKKPSGYIEDLWLNGELEQFTIDDIVSSAESNGYNFSRNSIRKSLLYSKFVTKYKKTQGHVIYRQKYPPEEHSSTNKVEKSHVLIFNGLKLHKDIRKASSKLFLDSHFNEAVFAAFTKVNNLVKRKSKLISKDGKELMLSTFSGSNPILELNNFVTESDKSEQEGFMHIFAGSAQGIRNPLAHENNTCKDPWNAIEMLCLASMLVKKLEKSKLNKNNKKLTAKKSTK